MPHVSRKKLKKKVFLRINSQFIEKLTQLNSKSGVHWFTEVLLTPTEKTMMAKRISIILMLENEYPFWVIEKTLKVTQQTILRFWKHMKQRPDLFKFKTTNRKVGKKPNNFWKEFEDMFFLGMPKRGHQTDFMRRVLSRHFR